MDGPYNHFTNAYIVCQTFQIFTEGLKLKIITKIISPLSSKGHF